MSWKEYISEDIQNLYEIHDYKHAATILSNDFPSEFIEICTALRQFRFSRNDIIASGGNESQIPKILSNIIHPLGWKEKKLEAQLEVFEIKGKSKNLKSSFHHGTHLVDYLKNRVAFDLEWNSKDQTFDRDLYAFRAFFEYDAISVGVLVTRSLELDQLFKELGINKKYGASTTHLGKLIPRLDAGRNGGCPVLIFGITTKLLREDE